MTKKIYFSVSMLILMFFLGNILPAQVTKPQAVQRIIYEVRSDDWYRQQAKLWEKSRAS
ncbi:MAG: hypothetical protein SCK70_08890 [bacterium]|nr:hypothetical protein [bacterium]